MGLKPEYLNYIESSIAEAYGPCFGGLRMLELGDQVLSEPGGQELTGKDYFSNRGYQHVSVDINGLHGATVRDLRKPAQFQDWHGEWDVITNSGTTEHVEPIESQYECFGIIHACLKVGGIAIHLVPDVVERDQRGAWVDHCHNYYSKSFFDILAEECGYQVLSNQVIDGLRCAAMRKVADTPFMGNRDRLVGAISERRIRRRTGRKLLSRIGVGKALRIAGFRRAAP